MTFEWSLAIIVYLTIGRLVLGALEIMVGEVPDRTVGFVLTVLWPLGIIGLVWRCAYWAWGHLGWWLRGGRL